jgi:hypothetical protein
MTKQDKRPSHKKGMSQIDVHTYHYLRVAENTYFTVNATSSNEIVGLLVGTEVKKIAEPQAWPSKYWKGLYYSVLVECPNGETRRLGCDVLIPRKTDKYFLKQTKLYERFTKEKV